MVREIGDKTMLKIVMLVLSFNGQNVEIAESYYYDDMQSCEIAAIINQEDAAMNERFGYTPTLYVCDMIEEREA